MSKILIVSAVFPPEPIVSAKMSFDISNFLSGENDVTVVSPKPSRPYGFPFNTDTMNYSFKHVHTCSKTRPKSRIVSRFIESYSFGKHCQRYVSYNHAEIDLIYANTWPLFGQLFVIKSALKHNIPLILHIQDIYPESLKSKLPRLVKWLVFFLLPIDRYVLQKATKVVAISCRMKNYLVRSRGIESKKVTVVNNWLDNEVFVKDELLVEQNQSSKVFTFMYLGNLGPLAGIDLIIDAFNRINLNNCRLIIAGDGSMKTTLQEKVLKLKTNWIEFRSVPEGKVYEIQRIANVMLLPIKKGSASLSIPSKLVAYMFSAKPIIASVDWNSDTADAIKHSNSGWVVNPGEIDALASIMGEVKSTEPSILVKLGENGLNFAKNYYSKHKNLQVMARLFQETKKNDL